MCEWVRAAVTFDYCSLNIVWPVAIECVQRELHNYAYEARLNYLDLQSFDLVFITWNWFFLSN